MHCSVIEHGYDVIEFSNCSTEERGVSLLTVYKSLLTVYYSRLGSFDSFDSRYFGSFS